MYTMNETNFSTSPSCESYKSMHLTGSLRRWIWPNTHKLLFEFVVHQLMNGSKKTMNWVYGLTKWFRCVLVILMLAALEGFLLGKAALIQVCPGVHFVSLCHSSSHFHHYSYALYFSFLSLLFVLLFLVKLEPWAVICLFTLHNVLPVVGCWCILCCCHLTTLMFCEHVILRTEYTRFTAMCTAQICDNRGTQTSSEERLYCSHAVLGDSFFHPFMQLLGHFRLLLQISKQKSLCCPEFAETWCHSRDRVLTFLDLIIMVWLPRSVPYYLNLQTSSL
jgi:hypothetical protein